MIENRRGKLPRSKIATCYVRSTRKHELIAIHRGTFIFANRAKRSPGKQFRVRPSVRPSVCSRRVAVIFFFPHFFFSPLLQVKRRSTAKARVIGDSRLARCFARRNGEREAVTTLRAGQFRSKINRTFRAYILIYFRLNDSSMKFNLSKINY